MVARRRPFVTVHYAQTLDGRIATRDGDSRWVSCGDSLRFAHELRATHRAVVVGVGTVVADDPQLTVRLVKAPSPARVVVDSTLRLPLEASVLTDGAAPTIVATTARAAAVRVAAVRERGAEVLVADADADGRVALADLFARLRERDLDSVLVEGGRGLITGVLRERLVDRLVVCIAPKVLGSGIEAVGDLSCARMRDVLTFTRTRFVPVGDDMIFDGRLAS